MDAAILIASALCVGLSALAFGTGYRRGFNDAHEAAAAEIRRLKEERAALVATLSTHSAELSSIRRARMQLRYSA